MFFSQSVMVGLSFQYAYWHTHFYYDLRYIIKNPVSTLDLHPWSKRDHCPAERLLSCCFCDKLTRKRSFRSLEDVSCSKSEKANSNCKKIPNLLPRWMSRFGNSINSSLKGNNIHPNNPILYSSRSTSEPPLPSSFLLSVRTWDSTGRRWELWCPHWWRTNVSTPAKVGWSFSST